MAVGRRCQSKGRGSVDRSDDCAGTGDSEVETVGCNRYGLKNIENVNRLKEERLLARVLHHGNSQ